MDLKRVTLQVISSLPAIIVGLAALVFPGYALQLFVAFGVLLVGAVALWLFLSYRDLRAENTRLRAAAAQFRRDVSTPDQAVALPAPTDEHWKSVEEIDLLLDGSWDRTQIRYCDETTRLRTTVEGRNRFVVHLADEVMTEGLRRRWTYHSVERTAETTKITRIWEAPEEGYYAFVVEPVGTAPFHVTVRVERLDRPSMAIGAA